jgi:hypothetical protein
MYHLGYSRRSVNSTPSHFRWLLNLTESQHRPQPQLLLFQRGSSAEIKMGVF